jgi:UDP-glucose 4-epimerase
VRLLLVGGAGYVGSACLRWLLSRGHDAVAFDSLATGNRGAVPEGRLVVGDIADRTALAAAMKDCGSEAVMHFAAVASVPQSIDDPELYYRTNVQGSKNVLDAMRERRIQKLIFSSTAAVYGFHAEMPLREDSPQLPATPYGKTKLAAEWMIEDYCRAYGIGYALLRYFNACGADPDGEFGEDRADETHLIPLILYTALGRRGPLKIFGEDWPTDDGTCVRDYVHTDDLAHAHQLACESLEAGRGRIYNVGIGRGFSVRQVLAACESVVGRSIPHEVAGRRPGDPPVLIAGAERLKAELGWQPRFTSIDEIVESAWRWHERYPHGYASKSGQKTA